MGIAMIVTVMIKQVIDHITRHFIVKPKRDKRCLRLIRLAN